MSTAAILFSNLNDRTLSRLTQDRTVAAIPFACRYRLIDFALSEMVNADISDIKVVTNYNYHSLVNHIGTGKDWDLARREGGISIVSPFRYAHPGTAKMYATHLSALRSMADSIIDMKADTVILADCDCICNLDIAEILAGHHESGADVTFVVVDCPADYRRADKSAMFSCDREGRVERVIRGDRFHEEAPLLSTGTMIMNREYLLRVLREAAAFNYSSMNRDVFMNDYTRRYYRCHRHTGYFAAVADFDSYYAHSMELTRNAAARAELFECPERRIFTNVHNSSPVYYAEGAQVKDSMIADDCVIEGTVENSILFRGVKIGRGSVVRNSILFGSCYVGEWSTVQYVVADKKVLIGDGKTISGCESMPVYIDKGRHV